MEGTNPFPHMDMDLCHEEFNAGLGLGIFNLISFLWVSLIMFSHAKSLFL